MQEYVEYEIAIALSRTPKVRLAALADVFPTAVPVAGRQRREQVGVRAVTAMIPATSRFEYFTRC